MNPTLAKKLPVKELKYPIRRKQLASVFKIDLGVLDTWFKDIGITHGSTLSPKEIVTFINHYGWPTTQIIPVVPMVEITVVKIPS